MSEIFRCIPVPSALFFQEMHHLDFLAETLTSDLKAGASLGRARHIRIWSAACATGEEAYSIALSLLDALNDSAASSPTIYQPGGWRIEVVASDADEAMLAAATEGVYEEGSLRDVPEDLKKRYFLRGRGDMTGRVRVKQRLAELVHFHCLHLEEQPWPVQGPFDAIFVRNFVTGLPPEAQETILREMLRYLHPHAYLILGSSEQVPWLKDAVQSIGKGIYQLRPHGRATYTGGERRIHSRAPRAVE
ncbi:MAG: CheR family methyltransferase [Acidobacteriaceae bacterium]